MKRLKPYSGIYNKILASVILRGVDTPFIPFLRVDHLKHLESILQGSLLTTMDTKCLEQYSQHSSHQFQKD